MSLIPLHVPEKNEPLLSITAQRRQTDASLEPFDLTGATITMYVKATKDTADGSAVTFSGTITDAANGRFSIQLEDTATPSPGLFWYHIDAVIGAHLTTLQYGPFYVDNI